mmetsp:Transcript_132198/g.410863  ORF Transcript_132198/g.410863 Transcript_132198/m.410863 type:complete len:212 (+) Transcript_132198:1233-1868(+)
MLLGHPRVDEVGTGDPLQLEVASDALLRLLGGHAAVLLVVPHVLVQLRPHEEEGDALLLQLPHDGHIRVRQARGAEQEHDVEVPEADVPRVVVPSAAAAGALHVPEPHGAVAGELVPDGLPGGLCHAHGRPGRVAGLDSAHGVHQEGLAHARIAGHGNVHRPGVVRLEEEDRGRALVLADELPEAGEEPELRPWRDIVQAQVVADDVLERG